MAAVNQRGFVVNTSLVDKLAVIPVYSIVGQVEAFCKTDRQSVIRMLD